MIVFDFDGVISDSAFWYEEVSARICSRHSTDYDGMLAWMIEHGNGSWLPGVWDDETFLSELNRAFSIESSLQDIKDGCRDGLSLDPDVMRLISGLGEIAVFTDNPAARVGVIEAALPIEARITFSQAVGAVKAQPQGFERFIEANGITSGLFVDDAERNVTAARRCGFDATVAHRRSDRDTHSRDTVIAAVGRDRTRRRRVRADAGTRASAPRARG